MAVRLRELGPLSSSPIQKALLRPQVWDQVGLGAGLQRLPEEMTGESGQKVTKRVGGLRGGVSGASGLGRWRPNRAHLAPPNCCGAWGTAEPKGTPSPEPREEEVRQAGWEARCGPTWSTQEIATTTVSGPLRRAT